MPNQRPHGSASVRERPGLPYKFLISMYLAVETRLWPDLGWQTIFSAETTFCRINHPQTNFSPAERHLAGQKSATSFNFGLESVLCRTKGLGARAHQTCLPASGAQLLGLSLMWPCAPGPFPRTPPPGARCQSTGPGARVTRRRYEPIRRKRLTPGSDGCRRGPCRVGGRVRYERKCRNRLTPGSGGCRRGPCGADGVPAIADKSWGGFWL